MFSTGSMGTLYKDVRLKQNSSPVLPKEEFLANDFHITRHSGYKKTKFNVLGKTELSDKFNQTYKYTTKNSTNVSSFLIEKIIPYKPSLLLKLPRNRIIISNKNISMKFKFKGNECLNSSSAELLDALENISVKHSENSGISHTIKKREAVDNWKIKSVSDYTVVFVNQTKRIKHLSDVNRSVEYLKHTTEITVEHNRSFKNSNGTEIGYKSMKCRYILNITDTEFVLLCTLQSSCECM